MKRFASGLALRQKSGADRKKTRIALALIWFHEKFGVGSANV
jgi:hypothetical protein